MSWIWLASAPHAGDVFVFARRTFDADAGSGTLRLCADARYRAWLNGEPVGRGPVRSLPRDIAADTYEVHLQPGRNVLCVLARWYGRPTVHWLPGATARGGIWATLTADDLLLGTDERWRMRVSPFAAREQVATEGMPDPEWIDGRAWPHGWLNADSDDAEWPVATVVHGPAPGAHDLPAPAERLHVVGVVTEGETTLDLGFITNAHIEVAIEAGEIDLTCGEEIGDDGIPLDERNWSLRYPAARLHGERVEAFEPAGFRYVRARLTGGTTATIYARERTYPREDGAWFRCSDPSLEQIWHAGVRTLDLCSTDAYIDCPSREQRAWLGDDIVNVAVSLVCNSDLRLLLHDLRLHAAGQREDGTLPMVAAADFSVRPHTLPDANLHWVRMLARVFEHTQDRALLEELLPVSARILDHFERMRGPDGLLAGWRKGVDGWVFVDWAQMERGSSMAVMDALYAIALRDHATMCESIGVRTDARERASWTAQASEAYWDDRRGVYVDATRRVSQQTNAAAIVAGWASPERAARIIERICDEARLVVTKTPGDGGTLGERLGYQFIDPDDFDDEQNVVAAQPYFCHLLHEALAMHGRHDLLLRSIERWRIMVERSGTVEEYWDAVPGMGSRCHSWAATPTSDLIRHILGVRVRGDDVTVEPNLAGLSWAEARIPTRAGWVVVRADASGAATVTRENR